MPFIPCRSIAERTLSHCSRCDVQARLKPAAARLLREQRASQTISLMAIVLVELKIGR
jgi:hypothetical protein